MARLPAALRDDLRQILLTDGALAQLVTGVARADAVTLGCLVCLSPGTARILLRGGHDAVSLLAHEAEHVRQCRRLGLGRFLWRYLREYLAARRHGASHTEAYWDLSFERAARAAARRVILGRQDLG